MSRDWPMFHYTISRPAWYRRWVVWCNMPLRRVSGDVFEWDARPSMRFWSRERATELVVVLNKTRAKIHSEESSS